MDDFDFDGSQQTHASVTAAVTAVIFGFILMLSMQMSDRHNEI